VCSSDLFSLDDSEVKFQMANLQKDMFWRTPMANHRKTIRERLPEIDEEETEKILAYIQEMKENDPTEYYPSLDETGEQYCIQHFGLNLETLLYLAHVTGAVPYTHLNTRKCELEKFAASNEPQNKWTSISGVIARERLSLLAFPDAPFADELRKMGFLAEMRAYFAELKQRRYTGAAQDEEYLRDSFAKVMSNSNQEWLKIEKVFENAIGSKRYRESIGASFKAKLSPCFGEYSLEYLTTYLNSKFREDRAISPVRMALSVELPHMDTAPSEERRC